ncbi:MAG: bifunctional oligoribonuclease/PAP phosphatase NrnA [Armatimonadota bacterium]|nr:bifunctional oligoribonuclease/PAP phosphatase NrnA [bacterium]MCS7309501.1 bifunctional oligoribonuclease/PAP phosphatase NrnA [Armatimonadota bacterium]MDW8103464.1 bifunctional oligoribonuclease/PAP phosphatase NrnA [Armatimonadota bacterium]MDW8290056.1 bifunctional oligoribonuclease/PAP phosphatase NrnA [Armatimonadota bacterium]
MSRRHLQQAAQVLREARSVVLACHLNPDGDTLGCALALQATLEAWGKRVVTLSSDGVPEIYRFLPGSEKVLTNTDQRGFDAAVVCDTGIPDRIGRAKEAVLSARVVINIDHHVTEGTFGHIRIQQPKAAATAEIVYRLLKVMEAPFTAGIATCLLTGIITDTGLYRYMNVSPTTFRVSAALMEAGASPAQIAEEVFERRSLSSIRLLGRALENLQQEEDGRLVWSYVRYEDFTTLGASDEDTEGIVTQLRSVRDSVVIALLREVKPGRVRVSVRSRDERIDVAKLAEQFGGGGHRMAAGFWVDGGIEEAKEKVIRTLREWMHCSTSTNRRG